MYKYNSINHTNEKTEAFYCLKNNYDKEKTSSDHVFFVHAQRMPYLLVFIHHHFIIV